jgi:4'-phosphopantetheinyl transferase
LCGGKNMAFVTELVNLTKLPKPKEILNEIELQEYNSFKFEKRRIDWLGGRYSAKKAIIKALDKKLGYSDTEILNDANRKPYFKIKDKMYSNVLSISHCGSYAISAVGTDKNTVLGVDIEKIETRSNGWKEELLSHFEKSDTDDASLTIKWTSKEAVLKALGLGLSVDLHQLKIIDNKPVFSGKLLEIWQNKGSKEIKITIQQKLKNYIIAIAYDF